MTKSPRRFALPALVAGALALASCARGGAEPSAGAAPAQAARPVATPQAGADGAAAPAAARPVPRLVDLGAGKCIPCKAMAPILEELRKEYAGVFEVVFIDVWEDPPAAEPYKINLIPTQIFFDADGRERWRHEGFLAKADILAKWKELGLEW